MYLVGLMNSDVIRRASANSREFECNTTSDFRDVTRYNLSSERVTNKLIISGPINVKTISVHDFVLAILILNAVG